MKKHPAITSATCGCAKGKHRAGCGCVTEGFIRNARISHFLVCIQAEKDHTVYAQRMRELGQYHAKRFHSWSSGQCSFHPAFICSFGKCEDDNLHCAGKLYESKYILSCELHALRYEIECENRASNSDSIIHPTMGRGHSNLCEAAFSVLPLYRAKKLALNRLSYITLTNSGLIISCANYLDESPHISLFNHMGIPILDGMVDIWKEISEQRSKVLAEVVTLGGCERGAGSCEGWEWR